MRIFPSPMDCYFFRKHLYTIEFIFVYQGRLDVERFRTALLKTQELFPAVTARIRVRSNTELFLETTRNPVPMSVHHSETPFCLSNQDEAQSLLDPIINAENEALVKFRITCFSDTTCLGISFSHLIGDGFSFFMFLRSLSDLYLGQMPLEYPSNKRIELPKNGDLISNKITNSKLFKATGYAVTQKPTPELFKRERIFFTNAELRGLKSEASFNNPLITTNDAIMAYLLKRFHKYIPLSDDGYLIVRCPVDYRGIYPQAPSIYFGNAFQDAVAAFDPATFEQLTLGDIAAKVRKAILSVNEPNINAALICLDDLRKHSGLGIFEKVSCPGLLVSNISKLPLEKLDFGLGSPLKVLPTSPIPRLAIIFGAKDGVEVTFRYPTVLIHQSLAHQQLI